MAPSVLLYTILFTLEDKPVHKNQYIQMFLIWLSFLVKSKSLNENDTLCIIGDRFTLNYVRHETPFETVAKLLLCKYMFREAEQPKTLMEGCMMKYNQLVCNDIILSTNYDILVYTDVDVIINKSFKTLIMEPNSIIIHEENDFKFNYFSEGIPENEKNEFLKCNSQIRGLSAGKFIIYGKSLAIDIFNMILKYNEVKTNYYTLEQPLFNRAIYNYIYIEKKPVGLYNLNTYCVHYNTTQKSDFFNHILLDCAGKPGHYIDHMEKMLNILCISYAIISNCI
jgi:hypothetical protein